MTLVCLQDDRGISDEELEELKIQVAAFRLGATKQAFAGNVHDAYWRTLRIGRCPLMTYGEMGVFEIAKVTCPLCVARIVGLVHAEEFR